MKISVESINKTKKLNYLLPKDWVREKVTDPDDDFRFIDDISINLTVEKINNAISIKGNISGELELICPSCLENFNYEYNNNINIKVQKHKDDNNLTEKEIEDEEFYHINNGILDLEEIILSEIVVNYPYDKLCSVECKGLCQVCGTNLNMNTCEHQNSGKKTKNIIWEQLMISTKGV